MSRAVEPITVSQEGLETIRDAIAAVGDRTLHDWVAVAVWEGRDGDVTVVGEASPLQLKGYLHSGLWAAIHGNEIPRVVTETREISSATDVRSFPKGRMDVVRVGGMAIGRGTFEPGWRWSESLAPIVGTDLCPLTHVGLMLAGSMEVQMAAGERLTINSGEVFALQPGHDAWTLGDETCKVIEILAADDFALPWREASI